jgi:plastocyanin
MKHCSTSIVGLSSVRRFAIASVVVLAVAALTGCSREDLGPVANARSAEAIRKVFTSEAADDGSGEQVAAATGTGWGTLKGRFVYDGDPPQMSPYNVTKEPEICTHGGKAPLQETLVIDSATKGIKDVAIYLREASRVHESANAAGEVVFDQKECMFLSHLLPVTVGQTVLIKNSDPTGHNTKIGGKMNFNQTIAADQAIPFKPQKEEAVPATVACSIHPWMVAYMLPRDNGYHAVTAPDGSFEIANLPAGEELEIQVWHESSVNPSGLVITTPEAKELNWNNKGRFTITVPENETRDLGEIKVPATAFKG